MSLEAKIEKLTAAVEMLTKVIVETDIKRLEQVPGIETIEVQQVQDSKPREVPKEAVESAQDDAPTPTVEDLQSLCMKLVRSDKANKQKIVELVSAYKGAKTIAQVPPEKLPELKTKLEQLQ